MKKPSLVAAFSFPAWAPESAAMRLRPAYGVGQKSTVSWALMMSTVELYSPTKL